ncbi:MAG: T9SS type A sorting domain-containing protein, partial [Bacteroidota bacterium]
ALANSSDEARGNSADEASSLFTLELRATTDAELSDLLSLTGRITGAEAYPLTGGVSNLVLGFESSDEAYGDSADDLRFALGQNVPNPVDGVTQIGFMLPKAETAVLTIRDVQGRTVIVREIEGHAGTNLVPLNRSELGASGVYSYTLVAGQHAATKQMIIR